MKRFFVNENIFNYLKEIDNHYTNELIGLSSNEKIPEEIIDRIQKNGWQNKNSYFYIIDNIDKNQVSNFLSTTKICKGVVFDLKEYTEDFQILVEHAISINYNIYINARIPEEVLNEKNIRYTKRYGNLYDIS